MYFSSLTMYDHTLKDLEYNKLRFLYSSAFLYLPLPLMETTVIFSATLIVAEDAKSEYNYRSDVKVTKEFK
ncbi:hypothetical protein F2Q69_00048511 [Brassica cretica]|uniref:Uncharacterized protein n=1 Tax=Brassica cretica TaxID=69181 RepID=A0A8S9PNZ9_BRACR|nr:hypothetical protein F2Q69_00048511 [Brassica cretica]